MTIRVLAISVLALACGFVVGCDDTVHNKDATVSNTTGPRDRGAKAANADVKQGILKLKEYPPLPYSLEIMNFIRLLKSECGVGWEVVDSKEDSKIVRAEVEGYNGVMRQEIQKRFGADIFDRLHRKAGRR